MKDLFDDPPFPINQWLVAISKSFPNRKCNSYCLPYQCLPDWKVSTNELLQRHSGPSVVPVRGCQRSLLSSHRRWLVCFLTRCDSGISSGEVRDILVQLWIRSWGGAALDYHDPERFWVYVDPVTLNRYSIETLSVVGCGFSKLCRHHGNFAFVTRFTGL